VLRIGTVVAWLLMAAPAASAGQLSTADMVAYLTQSVCLDAAGRQNDLLPIDPACIHKRPQTARDIASYRKHDWPDLTDPRSPLLGYQASDSVVLSVRSMVHIEQTFDFGDTRRVFGRFDVGVGDGGQVLVVVDGQVGIAMTEDGGDGVQWFISADCQSAPESDRRFLGWLVFGDDVSVDRWHDAMTRLNKARAADACPSRFNAAYTRYRIVRLAFPFALINQSGPVKREDRQLDVIVSEHYGGRSIETADHLERFYFARGLGLLRWERWANPAVSRQRDIGEAAAAMERSGRCPRLDALNETADRAWELVDCRMWTRLVRAERVWSVADYAWRALEALETLTERGKLSDPATAE
jgi:hypothetical protein